MTEFLLEKFVAGYPDTERREVRTRCGNLAGTVGIVCNLLLCLFKFAAGMLSGSIAISADAMNNLSDASSSVITLLGFRMAARPADQKHPYGHGRTEYLSGLAVSVMVMLIGLELAKSSVGKIVAPEPVQCGWLPVTILVVSICVKLWMAAFNRAVGKKINSAALEATAADSRNDVFSTGAVLLATLVQGVTGWMLDGWMGLAVAAFILYSGYGLIQDTIAPLLGQAPDPELVAHIYKKARSYPGVLGIHDLIVHDYGPGRQFASLHVEMSAAQDVLEGHEIIDSLERDFSENDGLHVVIHYDPIVTSDARVGEAREYLARRVKEIDPQLTLHDLRMVPGENRTNLIFDLVVPYGFGIAEDELKDRVSALAREKNPGWTCVITVENSYI